MSSSLFSILTYTALPMGTMIVGGVVAAFRPPGSSLRSYIQHFAAGVIFSAVAVELLPDVKQRYSPLAFILGFSLGVGAMLGVKWLSEKYRQARQSEREPPTSLVVTVGVDVLIDGLLIGLSFALGAEEGKLLTFALEPIRIPGSEL
jgi:ZIP family zinc transporter